jgi:hypothetical protein
VESFYIPSSQESLAKKELKGIGSILFLKNGLEKNFADKIIKIISEVTIMRYVQL